MAPCRPLHSIGTVRPAGSRLWSSSHSPFHLQVWSSKKHPSTNKFLWAISTLTLLSNRGGRARVGHDVVPPHLLWATHRAGVSAEISRDQAHIEISPYTP
jgi:hypothetical protein